MIEKRWKSTARSYKHSHKKSAKSFAKGLDKAETHLIIFSDKRQATSDKRQATSDKRQATSNKQQATSDKRHKRAICPRKFSHTTVQFYSKQPWFSKGGCVPLKPPAFCRGKERHLSQKGIQTKISKELRRYENRTSCPIFNPSLLRKLAYSWQ